MDMNVSFRLRGVPPFTLKIGPNEVSLKRDDLTDPDLKVECNLTPSELFRSKRKTFALIKALLTRRIRIKGSLRGAIKMYSLSKFLVMLFE